MEITFTRRGVRTIETSRDPYVVRLIHAHADAVTGFVKEGRSGMAKRHDLPQSRPASSRFLGKGDGIRTCPVTGEPIDPKVKATIGTQTLFFCCESCIAVVKKNPRAYLKPPSQ